MSDFERDDIWQRKMRDKWLVPNFYESYAFEGRYVKLDKGKMATLIQRRYAADTVVQKSDGSAEFIEEKIVRWPGYEYQTLCLETDSCTVEGRESEGWMHYGQADYLLYALELEKGMRVYIMDFPKLKTWFWDRVGYFKDFGPLKTLNATKGKLVPVTNIFFGAPTWVFTI